MNFFDYWITICILFGACNQETTQDPDIPSPNNLEIMAVNASSVRLSWTNSKPGEQDKILIERKSLDGPEFAEIESLDPGSQVFVDERLKAETSYIYRIRAKKVEAYSEYSNEAEVTTYRQVVEGEFLLLNTQFKGGSTGSKTNPSRSLAYSDHQAELGKYGGWKEVQLAATGKFRTEKYNDTWYLVDPEGYLYFGMACNSIKAKSEYTSVVLPNDLKEVGFNHLGNWSDFASINNGSEKIPYTFRELFLSGYKNTSQRTKDLYADGIIAIFDPEFEVFADELAQLVALRKDDPYCIGVFSDNELPIYTNETYGVLLDRYLSIPDKSDPNFKAVDEWMIARKGTKYSIDELDDLDWHGKLMSSYYQKVYSAIKKYAPDMLYLGSRLHGGAKTKNSIFGDSAPYVDVFSVNYYGTYDPHAEFDMWVAESNKPFLISEFYGKGFDVNLDNSTGAGYHVPTQHARALYFENIVIRFLESEGCVGYQWHKFQDDNSNRGIVDKNEQWYEELRYSLIKMNKDIYNFRNYLRSN